jgi:hypothetical protein
VTKVDLPTFPDEQAMCCMVQLKLVTVPYIMNGYLLSTVSFFRADAVPGTVPGENSDREILQRDKKKLGRNKGRNPLLTQ